MKTLIKSSLLLASIVFFTSCEDDVKKTYEKKAEFSVSLESNSIPANLHDTVDFSAEYRLYLSTFKAYLSNITLIEEGGKEVLIKDIALISLDHDQTSRFTVNLPSGKYTKMRIGIGLDPEQNDSDPNSFTDNNNPLSSYQGMYWSMVKYRFVVLEGLAIARKDTVNIPFAYHTGTDPLYQVITFDTDVNASSSALGYSFNLSIDLNTLFDGPAGKIDIATQSFTHSEGPSLAIAATFMENLKAAIHLNTTTALE